MTAQFTCRNEARRALARDTRTLPVGGVPVVNGIDYLEVGPDQLTLRVQFIHNLPGEADGVPGGGAPPLDRRNFVVEGGERVAAVRVLSATVVASNALRLQVSARGDFSTYRLRLVAGVGADAPPAGFDPALASVPFSFKIDCPSDFDCADGADCPPALFPPPRLDYLAKDYASFRRLLLDRLALTMPKWRERNVADVGVTLVELLAYAGDQLSQFQDAVATEAYLGTARSRVSLHRHARLLDYAMHEGVNARTWVTFEVEGDTVLPRGTLLLTRLAGSPAPRITPGSAAAQDAVRRAAPCFETLHDAALYTGVHRIPFYTWGNAECCLPRGATRATLEGNLPLSAGDVLILEETRSARTGLAADADPAHRQAVRLVRVTPGSDPLGGALLDPPSGAATPVTEVEWHTEDALRFPLCLSARVGNVVVADVSVARGNVVLADHGRTVASAVPTPDIVPGHGGRYLPRLPAAPIARCTTYDHAAARQAPAHAMLAQDPRRALPAATLIAGTEVWEPRHDLLASDRFASDFVVETETDGRAYVRFGDGVLGRRPSRGTRFALTYREGGGSAGNVGADALHHVVTSAPVARLRNPLPASGGQDPESMEAVRLDAPVAFRRQERAVTPADYEAITERHPDVQKAKATRRWTGSWHTMFVTVDRRGGGDVDADFEEELRAFLEPFRLAGHDLEIDRPRYVPLDVALRVCIHPGFVRADVEATLIDEFSRFDLGPGRRGFFHPDALTFGEPVYLSALLERAMAVQGVSWIEPLRFQRWGVAPQGEILEGRIRFDRLEIARLDNDPNRPENGRIAFVMQGGL